MITAKSYFSGAGGMDLGLIESGISVIEHYEIDKKCCDTLRTNLNGKVKECDISKITVLDQQEQIYMVPELEMIYFYIFFVILH